MRPGRREGVAAALALAALALLVHRDVVFGGRALFDRDFEHVLYERLFAFRAAVAAGALPLWNPYPSFGEPLLAVANWQFLYPTTWLALPLPPDVAEAALVLVHTLVAGLGVWALARELGASRTGALVAGALWSVSGPLQSCANATTNLLVGSAWISGAWWAFARHARTGRARDLLLAGAIVAACLLGGSPESALASCAGGMAFVLAVRVASTRDALSRTLRAGALAALVGLGLSAVQWVPTAALARHSSRADLTSAERDYWANHPMGLTQLVLPLSFEDLPLAPALRERWFQGREPLLYSLYLGLGALALSSAAVLGGAGQGRLALAGIAAVAFWLSLGRWGLLWDLASLSPPLSLIRFPGRFAIVGALALAVLSAHGVDALAGPAHGGRRRWTAAALVVSIAALALALLARADSPLLQALLETSADFGSWSDSPVIMGAARAMARAALLALPVAGALWLRALGSQGRPWLAGTAGAAAVLDALLCLGTLGVNSTVPRSLLAQAPPAIAVIPRQRPNRTYVVRYDAASAQALLGRPAAQQHLYDATPEQKLWNGRYYPLDAMGTPGWSIESVPGNVTGLRDAALGRWIDSLGGLVATPAFPRLAELSGIQFVIALHDLAGPRFRLLSLSQGRFTPVRTYAVAAPLPRAFAVGGVRVAAGQRAFDALLDEGFAPLGEVVLAAGRPAPAQPLGPVVIRELGFDRVVLEAELSAPGHVVLLESYDPGWQAAVDGRAVPVERANIAFRAVAVPAGRHSVVFQYRPRAVLLGALLSLGTALGVSLAWRRVRP